MTATAYPPKLVSRARQLYLLLTGLFAAGTVLQVFFAGLGALVEPHYFAWHTTFAHVLELTLLGMLVTSLFGRVGWRSFGLNALLFTLFGIQYFFMYGLQGPLRALHVVNALALFWLAVQLAQRSWKLVRETQPAPGEAGHSMQGKKSRLGRQLAGVVAILAGTVILFGVIFDNRPVFIRTSAPQTQTELREVKTDPALGASSAKGTQLFSQHCAACHGRDGEGSLGPALAGNDNLVDTDALVEQILDGGGGMPAFNRLSDEDVAAIGTHIRSSWSNDFAPVHAEDVVGQR